MNVDKQFRKLVFAQVLLGIVAFCIAERNVGLMLIAGSLTVLSRYVTEGPSNWHMPRWLLNLLALAAVAWLLMEMMMRRSHVIVAMGHFTMWLQILQLFAPRTNRDYGQILVLSLMLMIGASILTVSMVYGMLLAVYCVLGLWTVLWFQLKTTSDHVIAAAKRAGDALPAAAPVAQPVVGPRYRWHLRGMAVVIGCFCAVTSGVLFVVMPRAKENFLTQRLAGVTGDSKPGFSNNVNLNVKPSTRGDKDPVLNMRVTLNGDAVGSDDMTFLLRGAALDLYDMRTRLWQRYETEGTDTRLMLSDTWRTLAVTDNEHAPTFQADITLRSPSQAQVFTVHPTTRVRANNGAAVFFSPVDQQMTADASAAPMSYSITWPVNAAVRYVDTYEPYTSFDQPFRRFGYDEHLYARRWPHEQQKRELAALANRVLAAAKLSRDPEADYTPDDRHIVDALAAHLRADYRYSLNSPAVSPRQDPLSEFLFNHKTGHCELFASALAALCRSINIPARVITGYRVAEYNRIGGYYVVRQDDAHAWCEIDFGPGVGWRTIDPTPPADVAAEHKVAAGWFRALRDIYDYFEFRWLRSIVAYDPRARTQLLHNIRQSTVDSFQSPDHWLGRSVALLRDLPRMWRLDRLNYTLAGLILIIIGVALASLVRTLIIRRNRLAALQLTALPRARRRGLSRKLRFYLQMLDLLERYGHHRPLWQSPRHFAENLVRINPQTYRPVLALTDSFYAIRFGHRDPDDDAIRDNMRSLETALAQRT